MTGYSKARRTNSHFSSVPQKLTNIRPSHYFICVPRNSNSYRLTEPPQNDSVVKTRKAGDRNWSKGLSQCEQDFMAYDSKVKQHQETSCSLLPSERQRDAQQMTKTLRQYQNLKRSIILQNRKNTFASNRWRDGAGQVVNTMKGENPDKSKHSLRAKAYYQFQKAHDNMLAKKSSKCTLSLLPAA